MGVGVFGHRGACGYLPENTMPSFELAFEQGADAIEFDVVLTKDSIPVILHDFDLTKTTTVREYPQLALQVSELTLEQLNQLRVVERYPDNRIESHRHSGKFSIPTLSQVLANPKFNGKHLIIELKDGKHFKSLGLDLVGSVQKDLQHSDWSQRNIKITIESFEFSILRQAKNLIAGPIDYVFLSAPETLPEGHSSLTNELLAEVAQEFEGVSVAIEMLWGSDLVASAKRLGLKVFTYTARVETAQGPVDKWFEKLIRLGVDGIFADQPDRLIKRVRELA